MAAIWMDLSRYGDSHGYQDDQERIMWPWRDWVIHAYNSNMPYDKFITWWALLFIAILYTTAPAIAVFARTNLIETVSEKKYEDMPVWFENWE